MIEVVISIAIVGGLLASVFNIVGVSAKRGFATTQRTKAVWLASDLLAEIGAQPCESDVGNLLTGTLIDLNDVELLKGATQGGSRAAYDSVYDFNGWVSSPPVDSTGKPLPGFTGWTRLVTVGPVSPKSLARRTATDTAALITVVAVGPGNARHSVSLVRTAAADTQRGTLSKDAGAVADILGALGL
jgi:hypothetical protein